MATTNTVLDSSDWTPVHVADGKPVVFERRGGTSGEYFYGDEPEDTDAGHELRDRTAVSVTPPAGMDIWVRSQAGVRIVVSVIE